MYPPITTGSSYYTRDLAENMSRLGHNIVVITVNHNHSPFHTISDNIHVYRLPSIKLPSLKMWMGFPHFTFSLLPRNMRVFRDILIDHNIQIIHQCNTIFDLVFASSFWASRLKIPLFCSTTTQIQHLNKTYNLILDYFDRIVIKFLFSKKVLRYIALDKETERYISVRYGLSDNVSIVPYSIPTEEDMDQFTSIDRNYENSTFNMISLGHLSELKNREEFIKAWVHVIKIIPEAKFIIIGKIMTQSTIKLIESLGLTSNIIITGFVEHNKIYPFLIDADLGGLFFSSRLPFNKGFGTANIELMASGLPVIVNAGDMYFGDKFPIKDGKEFVGYDNHTSKDLANLIVHLFQNSRKRRMIGSNAQKFVRDKLKWENISIELETLYAKSLQSFE